MTKYQEAPAAAGGVASKQLIAIFERVERLEAEIKALNEDKSDLYQEAKGNGYNVKAIKAIVAERRKLEKNSAEHSELVSMIELYKASIGMQSQIDLFNDPSA
jgi:uncharacterized protein (UPF0335 family)